MINMVAIKNINAGDVARVDYGNFPGECSCRQCMGDEEIWQIGLGMPKGLVGQK